MEMPPYVEDGVAVVFSDRKQRGTGGRISQEYNAAARAREGENLRELSILKTLMIQGAIARVARQERWGDNKRYDVQQRGKTDSIIHKNEFTHTP